MAVYQKQSEPKEEAVTASVSSEVSASKAWAPLLRTHRVEDLMIKIIIEYGRYYINV
jgi:hypothetical protein